MQNENLWAPWRLGYINSAKETPDLSHLKWLAGADHKCFLCRNAVDPDRRTTLTLAVNQFTEIVLNRYPYNNGHLLVAPLRHVGRLNELTADEHRECSEQLVRLTTLLEKKMQCEGFNIGLNLGHASGAGLPGHLHWHIVPRWSGDTNFMPSTAGIRVLPQSLESLYEYLSPELS